MKMKEVLPFGTNPHILLEVQSISQVGGKNGKLDETKNTNRGDERQYIPYIIIALVMSLLHSVRCL